MLGLRLPVLASLAGGFLGQSLAALNVNENSTFISVSNDRLSIALRKSDGRIIDVVLDGQDLLGPVSGNTGIGPYLDCHCIPSGFWTPGGTSTLEVIEGVDSTDTSYAGLIMSDVYAATNQTLSQYLFMRDGETGLHAFSRLTYFNESVPRLRDLGEMRLLFRPNTPLWTHFSTSPSNYGSLPSRNTLDGAVSVQDATWFVGDHPEDPYVSGYSDYWTKYSLSEVWRNHDVHGEYSDGSQSNDGSTFGAWLVHNTVESYYGGPLHSDLVVDGIVYNYMVSSHHGAPVPNITHGFDRTWGPQFYYFNRGDPDATIDDLRADAAQYADPEWNVDFYDSIAEYIPNYSPSSRRTSFEGVIELPEGAKKPIIVLSENNEDFQLNVFDDKSLQYWAEINPCSGTFEIPRVVEGVYRVTIYADGIFGWYIQDDFDISGPTEASFSWTEESAGQEVWRIGLPDKSSGEYRHGYALDTSKTLQPEEYRNYWAHYDFEEDYPEGVHFHVGESDEAVDLNYVHWSFFPSQGNFNRDESLYDNVNNWTITFDLEETQLQDAETATLTVQIAGTRTSVGNAKWVETDHPWRNLPWTVSVNGGSYESTWIIPYWRSGSCAIRSAVACQNTEQKFAFPVSHLQEGLNEFVLSMPYNASSVEGAVLPNALFVQYDALRLELE